MKRVEALVRPKLLVWARESAGFSQEEAAKKAQVKAERLASWEEGERRPTLPQLRKLSGVYKRPLAVFYLSKPPEDFQAMHDFRRLPGQVAGLESPMLRLEVRKARYRRQVAIDLFKALDNEPARFALRGKLADGAESLAQKARATLGVTREQQATWSTPHEALNGWRTAVERLGILVFQASGIQVSEMRGFSLAELQLPVIVVNIKDHPHGRLFSLLHELAHLILHQEGLCDLAEDPRRTPEDHRIEVFCNQVAGSILMPREWVLQEAIVREHRAPSWTDEDLVHLSRTYRVSREAMLRRLLVLDKTSEAFYREKRRELLEEYETSREPKKGFAPPDRKAVSLVGPSFVRLVLNSFYQEKITSSDVSDYLEVKLKWLPRIEEAVFGQRQDVLAFA
jgi:Zn-dependent peptidase ImmA (M78 family)/transcriptional regulator with XRE-family HTH domain